MKKRYILGSVLTILIMFNGCANSDEDDKDEQEHSREHHSSSPAFPEGLEPAPDPTFKEGSQVIIKANHMDGMEGAKATVLNAYNTIVYEVTYTPTTGGDKVTNHKWVIQDEIKDAGSEMLEKGTEVVLEADHMEGMKGAKAEIEDAENTTVYMVDYKSTEDGEMITNHRWLTEGEVFAE